MFLLMALGCFNTPQPDDDGDGYDLLVDCDDSDAAVHPDAEERCNGEDDDCDGWRDEDVTVSVPGPRWWDLDCDGWGGADAAPTSFPCRYDTFDEDTPEECWTDREGDCDDDDWHVHPSNNEECNGVDDDCDGSVDEEEGAPSTFYADADGDGYGDPATTTEACAASDEFVADATDCDDGDAGVAPDRPEVCGNGVDDDCSAGTTDGCGYALSDLADATRIDGVQRAETCASVAAPGDMDGDGAGDLVIGAAGAEDDTAWWVPGPFVDDSSVSIGVAMVGASPTDATGSSVAGVGDLDGDGLADVLIGAPLAPDDTEKGAAIVRYGPVLADCAPYCAGALLSGVADYDGVGASVAGPGDVDGDGLPDLLIGAPGRDGGGGAYVVYAAPKGALSLSDADVVLVGEGLGRAGERVAGAGDVDGDGRADVAVVDTWAGVAWLVTALPESGEVPLAGATARFEGGSIATGDLDRDGTVDAVVGGEDAWGVFGPLVGNHVGDDAALTITGADWAPTEIEPTIADGELLLVAAGADPVPASIYTFVGPFGPGALDLSDADRRIHGEADLRVVPGGDLDADGAPDLVVGAPAAGGVGACFVVGGQ